MEYNELEVRLEKSVEDKLILKFDELEDCVINLEEPQADDLKFFFDSIFEYIAKNEKLIEFKLKSSEEKELFQNVSKDLVEQVNAEIRDSEENFNQILELRSPNY
ncbi:TPA: hypothetical protein VLQ55_001685 [Streptococcus pyogenes]|uniref:hypothetical protein n=1 Tax=Streptococcus pyogenes TaxID=1314 RepID=UPI0010A1068D|nr:hypothetical protein [Streptococcus pyogenes]VHF39887.1 Uncharacterised protein [Streptococcus pyogenes]HER6476574.1 hypothetical protein [Streptococcus pyogenes]HER6478024.1 hypothetical protein [Streptococcus pyogenes]HER6481516.1 hypothetical protein [Streptococcus pyogenes]HER6484932.1 hypothetical protein [Streptococcus pyogenes]